MFCLFKILLLSLLLYIIINIIKTKKELKIQENQLFIKYFCIKNLK